MGENAFFKTEDKLFTAGPIDSDNEVMFCVGLDEYTYYMAKEEV